MHPLRFRNNSHIENVGIYDCLIRVDECPTVNCRLQHFGQWLGQTEAIRIVRSSTWVMTFGIKADLAFGHGKETPSDKATCVYGVLRTPECAKLDMTWSHHWTKPHIHYTGVRSRICSTLTRTCNLRKTGQRCTRLLQRRAAAVALVASRVRLQYEEDEAAMYTAVAEEGSSGMERETTVVVFNLLLSVIKIVGSERLLRAAM
ncbi:hypothetical protein GW17_00055220 [Ensete ventricosum]|nr:hypothetical protein GW17_00055220 [Ensete ventricosum]